MKLLSTVLLLGVLGLAACTTSSPKMKVVGVEAPRAQFYEPAMQVFLEVHNPGNRDLELKRLEYRIQAEQVLDSRGEVEVGRVIGAGRSAIVEISVPVQHGALAGLRGVPYTLKARLFAVSDRTERSWALKAQGDLARLPGGQVHVAEAP